MRDVRQQQWRATRAVACTRRVMSRRKVSGIGTVPVGLMRGRLQSHDVVQSLATTMYISASILFLRLAQIASTMCGRYALALVSSCEGARVTVQTDVRAAALGGSPAARAVADASGQCARRRRRPSKLQFCAWISWIGLPS